MTTGGLKRLRVAWVKGCGCVMFHKKRNLPDMLFSSCFLDVLGMSLDNFLATLIVII